MKTATFNDFINLEYPDDFVQLTEEENTKYFTGDLMRLTFQNKEKHILLSLSKSRDAFINRFINLATVLIGAASNLENNLKDYVRLEEYESTISDRPSITQCFEYTASDQDVRQYGELTVFKEKKTFYIIYCISRKEDIKEAKKIFENFKDSMHID